MRSRNTAWRPKGLGVILGMSLLANCATAQPEYYSGTGHWYEGVLVPEGIYWAEASQLANMRGGYLACIASSGENTFANSLVNDVAFYSDPSIFNDRIGPWLGGFHNTDGIWHWVTGEPFEFTNWYPTQPDGYAGSIQKVFFYNNTHIGATWGDHPGFAIDGFTPPRGYVIEYDFAPITGTIELADYLPDEVGQEISVELVQSGLVVETRLITLRAGGQYSFATEVTGQTTLRAKASHFLAKDLGTYAIGEQLITGANGLLTNGDCDEDNEVGIGDYAMLSSSYGSEQGGLGWLANADLNGDESIDIADYAILSANYGDVGD